MVLWMLLIYGLPVMMGFLAGWVAQSVLIGIISTLLVLFLVGWFARDWL